MGKDLQIEAVEAGGEHVVYLTGELDLANATAAEEALFGMSASKVTVDLSGLSFIDSSGVGALIEARRRMEENGNSVEFRGARDTVRRVLDVINWEVSAEDAAWTHTVTHL